jgi:hypothetical protein
MSQFAVCVFPESVPREDQVAPLVQAFGQVVHLQPVEDEPLAAPSPAILELLQAGRLRLVTSVPLGDRRDRFLALVRDMAQRRDDYLSQLALLTLADLHRHSRPESGRSILSGLLSRAAIDQQEEETAMRLWQARLVLKLGELFDAEQAGLDEALQAIDRRQEYLLRELREETDDLFALTDSLQEGGQRTEAMLAHRLKAWSRLFFHRPSLPAPALFVTAHPAAMDTLADRYEAERRQSPQQLVSLELPVASGTAAVSAAPLIDTCPLLRATLLSADGQNRATDLRQGAADWAHRLDEVSAQVEGRSRLDLFVFPGMSARQLFLAAFAGERTGPGQTDPPPALVGTLTAR